ncbi:MAG: hypothetical protein E4G96_06825 [Chrysiogenales bacterium]|nr:MAG: hypothetical protein E4G96_06825 [Chrysiogenales bacterium]
MPNDDFDSLFDDAPSGAEKKSESDDLFEFDVPAAREPSPPPQSPKRPVREEPEGHGREPSHRKRTSEDFEPDMDALLITAQSPLIIEGMKCLTMHDFTANTLQIFAESLKGVEIFTKILERNPNNYFKLSAVINTDPDCKEIETVAFQLFKARHHEEAETDGQILKAYEILKNRLKIGYNKALVSSSMISIKKYYLLSGGLDREKISRMVIDRNKELKADIIRYIQHLNVAVQLMKIGDFEITKGLKGREINNFLIRASQLLSYYYLAAGDGNAEEYYRRMHDNYRKYFIIRE